MGNLKVKKTGHIGSTKVEEGQVIIHDGKHADIKSGEKYLAVSVFITSDKIEDAKKQGILEEI